MAYIDVKNLRKDNIRISFDDKLWLIGKREKTGVSFTIPLLDISQRILDKYEGALLDDRVLPVPSNQKVNAYLMEIGSLCGIDKELNFHVSRRTFATLAAESGLNSLAISALMGHGDILMTQSYVNFDESNLMKLTSDNWNNRKSQPK